MQRDTTITVSPPTIRLTVRLPRLYGVRLRLTSWLLIAANWTAGDTMEIEVSEADEDWTPEHAARQG